MNHLSKKSTISNRMSTDSPGNHGPAYGGSKILNDQQMRIFDEFGNDVTPLPMIVEDKRSTQLDKESTLDPSILQASTLQFFNQAFTRPLPTVSNPFSETTSDQSETHTTKNESSTEVKEIEEEENREYIDLEEQIYITVGETEVYWLFDQQPYFMPTDDEFASYQIQRNADYKSLCAARLGNDSYVERGMSTMPNPNIVKALQTQPIKYADKLVHATVYDLWDTTQQVLHGDERQADGTSQLEQDRGDSVMPMRSSDIPTAISRELIESSNPPQLSEGTGDVNNVSSGVTYSDGAVSAGAGEISSFGTNAGDDSFVVFNKSEPSQMLDANDQNLLNLLKNMEKAVNLNCYYEKYLQYRSVILNRLFEQSCNTQECSESDATAAPPPSAMKSNRASGVLMTSGGGGGAEGEGEGQRPSFRQTVYLRQSFFSPSAPDNVGGSRTTTGDTHDPSTPTGGAGVMVDGNRTSGANTENGADRASDATRKGTGNRPLAMEPSPSLHLKSVGKIFTPPALLLLWRFGCPLTKGRNVSSLAFNPRKKDILAVGYGSFEFDHQHSGLVCCWSLKKINFPERVFRTPSGVTAVAWSSKNENLLAVGMFNGVIMIFDARKGNKTAILDTTHSTGRHYGPVCKLEWVSRDAGRSAGHSENLVSCSMDGRITEWFTLKGFDCTGDCDYHVDLMLLKRPKLKIPNYVSKKKRVEALIVRHAVGTALCFSDADPNLYLVGTENGQIHKCSCSYTEQYLSTYNGHTSSVYALKYSPFLPDVFLSCSADWTIRLWHTERQKCYLTMATHSSAVNDLAWSHNHGAVFACTNEGNVEIWDLERSTLDPVHVESVSGDTTMSMVLFTEDSDTMMVGDSSGNVYVYAMKNFPRSGSANDEAEKLNSILLSCLSSQVPT